MGLLLLAGILVFMGFFIILFLGYFYRDPKRKIPEGENIISPADGKIIAIVKTDAKELKIKKGFAGRIRTFTKDLGVGSFFSISIFMNPLDVHINRAPISGMIDSIKHSKGKFYNAGKPKAFENEKVETIIDSKIGRIKVIQIAGFLARRIESFIKEENEVKKGERIGIIKLGSQVTLIIPADKVRLKVRIGQKVKAGSTIIGEII